MDLTVDEMMQYPCYKCRRWEDCEAAFAPANKTQCSVEVERG